MNEIDAVDSLAVKYRPQTIEDIIGNKAIKDKFSGYFSNRQIVKTILFAGPTGCGKTSFCRIIGKIVNCQELKGTVPCGECESCKQDIEFHSDFHEVNGTLAGQKDDIRNLIRLSTNNPRFNFSLICIDEAHGLSSQAKEALLKTTEKPPKNTIWMFCTTSPEKLPKAILSRCDKNYMMYPTENEIVDRLKYISKLEFKKKLRSKLKNVYSKIAYACNYQPRESVSALGAIAASLTKAKKSNVDKIIKEQILNFGELSPLVMTFLIYLYKGKIREPLTIGSQLQKHEVEEFLKLCSIYSHYATVYITSQLKNKVIGYGFWGVNRPQWEKLLEKNKIINYKLTLYICSCIANATEKVRMGLLSNDQIILILINSVLEKKIKGDKNE